MRFGVLLNLAGRVASVISGMGVSILVARQLGPQGRGQLAVAATLVGLLSPILTLGLSSANHYFIARERNDLPRLVGNSLAVLALDLPLLLGTAVVASLCHDFGPLTWIVMAWLVVQIAQLLNSSFFLGLGWSRQLYLIDILNNLSSLTGIVVLLYTHRFTLVNVLLVRIACWTLSGLIQGGYLVTALSHPIQTDWTLLREAVHYGLKGYFILVLLNLMWNADQLMTAYFLGETATGLYSVAASLVSYLLLIPLSMHAEAMPVLAPLKTFEEKLQVARPMIHLCAALVLLPCIFLLLSGDRIIAILFGQDFVAAAPALRWLIPGMWFMAVQHAASIVLASYQITNEYLKMCLGIVLLNLLLNLWWTPAFGILGAAWASTLTYLFWLLATAAYYANLVSWERRNPTAAGSEAPSS